jgi:cell division septum initiation protein DivIVA
VANSEQWTDLRHPVTQKEDAPIAIPIGQMSVLEDLIAQIEGLIRNAKQMPLSSSALLNRQEALDLVETLKRSIPEEVARARAVIRDRDDVIHRAEIEAGRLIERAKEQRERLIDKSDVVSAAAREAERLVADGRAEGERVVAEADRYVDSKLASFEITLQKTLAQVERGRTRLAGRLESELGPSDEEDLDEGY